MPPVVNQSKDDVTVVRATTEALTLNPSQCTAINAGSLDCTAALQQAAGGAPSFHQVVISTNGDFAGCMLLRVTTASKTTGLANSTGIGFWSATATAGNQAPEDSGLFIPKAQLKAAGTATLINGSPATLNEFAGLANCTGGGGVSLSRLFKPYMRFEGGADGKIFRNWDLADNYRIAPDVTMFDRSGDVLKP
jgi:hypothetical protein